MPIMDFVIFQSVGINLNGLKSLQSLSAPNSATRQNAERKSSFHCLLKVTENE